jgi:hypothetical protein
MPSRAGLLSSTRNNAFKIEKLDATASYYLGQYIAAQIIVIPLIAKVLQF